MYACEVNCSFERKTLQFSVSVNCSVYFNELLRFYFGNSMLRGVELKLTENVHYSE